MSPVDALEEEVLVIIVVVVRLTWMAAMVVVMATVVVATSVVGRHGQAWRSGDGFHVTGCAPSIG